MQRVVITGRGVVCSLGERLPDIRARMASDDGVFCRPDFDGEVVTCPVEDFDLARHIGRWKHRRYLNRGASLGLAAASMALQESGIADSQRQEMGLFAGVGPHLDIAGTFAHIAHGVLDEEGMEALWLLRFLPNTLAGAIAQRLGARGENLTVATACTASLQAIGEAWNRIRFGQLRQALAGGGDSRISSGGILGYKRADALYRGEGPPAEACRPFDSSRSGFICGEGGAFVVLESLESAQERGAAIYGELTGYACTMDGLSLTAPDPLACQAEVALRRSLERAGDPVVDLVCAHGTGTPLNDAMEAELIGRMFGDRPLVTAFKSWIGHLSAASGAADLLLALGCLESGQVPPVRNLHQPCHHGIRLSREFQPVAVEHLVVQNFGFGGQNAALVVRAWNGR